MNYVENLNEIEEKIFWEDGLYLGFLQNISMPNNNLEICKFTINVYQTLSK